MTAAARVIIKAKSFTIDGEAVVLGRDGLSRFEELSTREGARTAILYAFDLIEDGGEDMRNRPFLDRKAALARLLRDTEAGIRFNEPIAEDGSIVFAHACRLGAEGIVSKKVDAPTSPARAASGSRSAIPPASPCRESAARNGMGDPSRSERNL
jgi:ATP-dependent DNA ligase